MGKAAIPARVEEKKSVPVVITQGTRSIEVFRPSNVETYDVEEEEGGAVAQTVNTMIPILRILQNGSPQVVPVENGGIAGAKPGSIFNTQTKEIYDGRRGLFAIVACTRLMYPEYIKREKDGSGGGFRGIYEPEDPEVKKAQQARMEAYGDLRGPLPHGKDEETGKDLELIETYYLDSMLIVPNEDGSFPAEHGKVFRGSLPFSSTNINVYNGWQEKLKAYTYPKDLGNGETKLIKPRLYTHVFHVRTELKKRGQQNWMIWNISLAAKNPDGTEKGHEDSRLLADSYLYHAAADLRVEVLEGSARFDYTKDTPERETGGAGGGNGDIPTTFDKD
jgi:hypothetical protein